MVAESAEVCVSLRRKCLLAKSKDGERGCRSLRREVCCPGK